MKYMKRGRRTKKESLPKRISNGIKKRVEAFTTWFKKLSKGNKILFVTIVAIVLTLLILGIVAYSFILSKFNKVDTLDLNQDEIEINEEIAEIVGTGYTNFVLFGSDSRSEDVDKSLNTDTIIIVSLNNETKEVKMVSVYRDTLLDIGKGNIQKCNSAYSKGGAKQAINMLNRNLDLNIQKYVTVSFNAVIDVVDKVGGIEVDLTEKEWKVLNDYVYGTAHEVGVSPILVQGPGKQTLNGLQALTYARIRKGVGDDYARTERQRIVIQKVAEKVMQSNLTEINEIIDAVLPMVSTNFSLSEILGYAKSFMKYSFGETSGFPFESRTGNFTRRGSCVYATTLKSNVSELHHFLFGTVDYAPSSVVKSISDEISYFVSTTGSGSSSGDDDEDTTTDDETNELLDNTEQDDESTEDPSTDDPAIDDPAVEDPTVDDPTVNDPTTPPADNPTTPPVEEPTTPPVEEPTTPPVEEPTTPPVEEPTTPPTVEQPTGGTEGSGASEGE